MSERKKKNRNRQADRSRNIDEERNRQQSNRQTVIKKIDMESDEEKERVRGS